MNSFDVIFRMKIIKYFNSKNILSFFKKHQNKSPFFNAKGIAIGVFSGCFPFFGFQTIIGIILAKIFKGNLLLAAICTWVSNPFTYIPLYLFNYKVGSFLISSSSILEIKPSLIDNQIWQKGWNFSMSMLIGSFFVGINLAIITGLGGYFFYKYFLKKNSKIN